LPKQELQTLGAEHWRQLATLQETQAPLTTLYPTLQTVQTLLLSQLKQFGWLQSTQASPLVEVVKLPEQTEQKPLSVQVWQLAIRQKALQAFPESWYPVKHPKHWFEAVLQLLQLVTPQLATQPWAGS
jgi:hypothetical protein